ncbi:MAG: peptidoglycan-binding domain-containing protein [Phaeovulum sp.]|uniref:peptidoglycan-binding domain-containing protein n=1 Tax=Phaeovulum sp. TaxID=2934796 RepID=UPI002730EC27|nr:peptidoglycan-binding domain-containing protein [Phaeovulum sp.]MDP2061903.1 peptidoglycan-binding domain-containing protein [Phaeovulum sp.]
MRLLPLIFVIAGLAAPLFAENRALIIANSNYRQGEDLATATQVLSARAPLEAAGFKVFAGADLGAVAARGILAQMLAQVAPGDRVVILLAGHFARSGQESWFLGTDALRPDLATVGGAGLALGDVLEIAATAPGGAVLLLGTEPRQQPLGRGLQPGIGALEIPQGVTVVQGDTAAIATFAAQQLPLPGQSLKAKLSVRSDLLAQGFLSDLVPFLPIGPGTPTGPVADPFATDRAFWEATQALATPEAYDAYVARYPNGLHAAEARAEAARIRAEPGRLARLAEDALGLSRDQRREVQRQLALLGYDPNGIDGLFGRGTRTALTAWQRANAFEANGYLTRAQINEMAAQAKVRAATLEAEARIRQAEQEQADRLYWSQTGAAGDELGLRAYMRRYPDGLFADLAAERLALFDAARAANAAAADRAEWDRAEAVGTREAYAGYLAAMPQGSFADIARERIAALDAAASGESARAEAEARERALGLPALALSLIEARLGMLGLEPGAADGNFDEETRRAIRRFQQARGLTVSGYLDQDTVAQLLSGAGN